MINKEYTKKEDKALKQFDKLCKEKFHGYVISTDNGSVICTVSGLSAKVMLYDLRDAMTKLHDVLDDRSAVSNDSKNEVLPQNYMG